MKHLRNILISMTLLIAAVPSFGAGINFHHDLTYQQALDLARKEGKLVFMDCYTSWCGPCKRLATQVFTDSAVGVYFNNNYINVKFDMEKEEGPSIATRFQVTAYPTLIWVDANGSIKNKVVGALDATGLINGGKTAAPPINDMMLSMDKKYADGARDQAFLEEYLKLFRTSGRDFDPVFADYLKEAAAHSWPKQNTETMVFDLTNNFPSPGIDLLIKYKNDLIARYGVKAYNDKIMALANMALAKAKVKDDENMLKDAIGLVKGNNPDSKQEVARMEMDYYMSTAATPVYDKYVSSYIKKYAATDDKLLNDAAWSYYIGTGDAKLLKKACQWAFKAVNIKNTCANNTTYAYLQYKLHNYSEATKACDYAIIRAKEENTKPVSALALKDAINKETPAVKSATPPATNKHN